MFAPARFPLLYGPTPLHPLERMSAELGIDLWIKRDDLTGFAAGGNKGRKLEYLIPDIKESGADVVICSGSTQSNFVRQAAAACRMIGVECRAVVMDLPYDGPAGKPEFQGHRSGGNRQLAELFGCRINHGEDDIWEVLAERVEQEAQMLFDQGRNPYVLPVGGSSLLGAYSFVQAGKEIDREFDWIVTASSSGSTQAGLTWHFAGGKPHVIGVACDPEPELDEEIAALSRELDDALGVEKNLQAKDLDFRLDWVGEGYGVPSAKGEAAFERLMQVEGICLDPVYTAKAFSALIDLAEAKEISGRVLFWHTGGVPALMGS